MSGGRILHYKVTFPVALIHREISGDFVVQFEKQIEKNRLHINFIKFKLEPDLTCIVFPLQFSEVI